MNVALYGKKGLCTCAWIKNLEMRRLSWIIWVDLKRNHMYPHKREAEENVTHRRGEDNMTMEGETAIMESQPKECGQLPEAGRGKEWILP